MRKAAIGVVFLALIGIAVFVVGWTQLNVPPGAYGVLVSKTGGVRASVLKPGVFAWAWEPLLPTNIKILSFSLSPIDRPFSVSFNLPEATEYAAAVGGGPSFSFSATGSLSFSVSPEALPDLVAKGLIKDQVTLDEWQQRSAEEAITHLTQKLEAIASETASTDHLLSYGANPRIIADLERAFPRLSGISYRLSAFEMPDYDLYEAVRKTYRENALAIEKVKGQKEAAKTEKNLDLDARFAELERYGRLLTEYPSLIEYLKLEQSLSTGSD